MNFQVPQLPSRSKRELPQGWLRDQRLGPRGYGSLGQQLKCPLPSLRGRSIWEVSGLLEAPHRLGRPATIHAGASLGPCFTGYPLEEIALDHCNAGRSAMSPKDSNLPNPRAWPDAGKWAISPVASQRPMPPPRVFSASATFRGKGQQSGALAGRWTLARTIVMLRYSTCFRRAAARPPFVLRTFVVSPARRAGRQVTWVSVSRSRRSMSVDFFFAPFRERSPM